MRPLPAGVLSALLLLPSAAHSGRISVATDARLELIGAAQMMAPQGARPHGYSEPDLPYIRALKKRLDGFKTHPAVLMNADPTMLGFSFGDRGQLLLRLSPPPKFSERLTIQYSLMDRAGGAENMRLWLKSLSDLSRASRFADIFAAEGKKLEPAVARFRAKENEQDYLGTMETYAGLPLLGTYAINLSPFHAPGGVANVVAELPDGTMEISSVIGPEVNDAGIDFWSRRVPGTLWHESAHGVLDGLGDLYADRIALSSAAYAGIGWDCYGNWNQCVKEHVVRSVMIRLMAREISEESAEEQIRFEKEEHYPYLRAILEKLKIYEKERARYPTLADYYPQLLGVFPSSGSISAGASPLSDSLRRRAQRLSQIVVERAREPEALEAARRFAATVGPSRSLVEKPVGPRQSGIEAFTAGRLEDALRLFDAALSADQEDVEALMSRAVVLQALSRGTHALDSYDRAVALAEAGARGRFREILPDALASRGYLLLELGDRERARADLSRALTVSAEGWPQRDAIRARLKALPAARP